MIPEGMDMDGYRQNSFVAAAGAVWEAGRLYATRHVETLLPGVVTAYTTDGECEPTMR